MFLYPWIEDAWDRRTGTLSPGQERALRLLDRMFFGTWRNLRWPEIASGAAQRILDPSEIDQRLLNVCGPAAALQPVAETYADRYASLVIEVFTRGTVQGRPVNPGLLAAIPQTSMSPVDWMMLSALQDVERAADPSRVTAPYLGAPDALHALVVRENQTTLQVEDELRRLDQCVQTRTYDCTRRLGWVTEVSRLLSQHPGDTVCVAFVDAAVLQGSATTSAAPNHFIRLVSPMNVSGSTVSFRAFTWGGTSSYSFPWPVAQQLVWNFIVGCRTAGVPLP